MKVLLHVSNLEQIDRMQSNIKNLLKEDKTIEIAVVINGEAVKAFTVLDNLILEENATYYICENSLKANGILEKSILKLVKPTNSGVYKLALLHQKGYFYIKVWWFLAKK